MGKVCVACCNRGILNGVVEGTDFIYKLEPEGIVACPDTALRNAVDV